MIEVEGMRSPLTWGKWSWYLALIVLGLALIFQNIRRNGDPKLTKIYSNTLMFSWEAPEGYQPDYYKVVSILSDKVVAETIDTNVTLRNLQDGEHIYGVRACMTDGCSGFSNVISFEIVTPKSVDYKLNVWRK